MDVAIVIEFDRSRTCYDITLHRDGDRVVAFVWDGPGDAEPRYCESLDELAEALTRLAGVEVADQIAA